MDGENSDSKPYFLMDDLGGGVVFPLFLGWKHPYLLKAGGSKSQTSEVARRIDGLDMW